MKAAIIKWVQKIFGIEAIQLKINEQEHKIQEMREVLVSQARLVDDKLEYLEELHKMDADENYRGQCTIILTGVFRGRGYVKFIDVDHDEFRHMVEMYRGRKSLFRNEDRITYQGGSFQI